MSNNIKTDFNALENNIIDVIKEEQIKLGYTRETIRLYYPIESINHLLTENFTIAEIQGLLDQFCEYVKPRLGEVTHSNMDTRFCFVIPSNGVTYVHEKIEDRPFLKEFIEAISKHNQTLSEILSIFHRYSDCVICNKMDNGEFDYLVYFSDGLPDAYMYCLKFENCHVIYHRFTKADYDSFGF